MADKLAKISREDNVDESVKQYHVSYNVEDGADTNSFCIVIKAEDMTLATDEAEAKTLAKAEATIKKDAWVAAKAVASSITSTSEPDETVSL